MTSHEIEAEMDREPFVPLRFHLVSGKTIDVRQPNAAFTLQNGLLVLHRARKRQSHLEGYDVVSFRNIERIEQLVGSRRGKGNGHSGGSHS